MDPEKILRSLTKIKEEEEEEVQKYIWAWTWGALGWWY